MRTLLTVQPLSGRWPDPEATGQTHLNRWDSAPAIEAITSLLAKEASLAELAPQLGLAHWEIAFLRRPIAAFARARQTPAQRTRTAKSVAFELELLHRNRLPKEALLPLRLVRPEFTGRLAHLKRLLASVASPTEENEWNEWRAHSSEVPDLRGADLSELDLRHVDLSAAKLRRAILSGAAARQGNFRDADLRDCALRHTDLSYADLRGADLRRAKLEETLLSDADLEGADLRQAFLIGTLMNRSRLIRTKLTGAIVWGVSTWDVESDETTEQDKLVVIPQAMPGDIDQKAALRGENALRVDGLEVAHFVALLNESRNVGRVINAAADKIVLLLGRFVGRERRVLDALRVALPNFGYVPVVFDFEEPENRDTIETVAVLAGLSSFVIANLGKPRSTPLEANVVIPTIAVPFVPILRRGETSFAMFAALQRKYEWVLEPVVYGSEKGLVRRLKTSIIEPAERMARRVRSMKHPTQLRS